jgi:hypothetical protein
LKPGKQCLSEGETLRSVARRGHTGKQAPGITLRILLFGEREGGGVLAAGGVQLSTERSRCQSAARGSLSGSRWLVAEAGE